MKRLAIVLLLAIRAHATIALVAHTLKQTATGSATSLTTSAINCSGANFLLMAAAFDNSATSPAASDSSSNTWTTTLTSQNGGGVTGKFFYAEGATVSSSQTFTLTVSGSTNFLTIAVACYSGVLASGSHDQENSGSATLGANASTGSVTPSQANELIVGLDAFTTSISVPTFSSSSGNTFTETDGAVLIASQAYGDALIYFVQTTATAENVTWVPPSGGQSVIIETFKAAASGGTTPPGTKEKKFNLNSSVVAPNFCAGMTMPDCNAINTANMASFICLFSDGSCGQATIPVNTGGTITAVANVCLLGSNTGTLPLTIGSLGAIDPASYAFSCTP